MRKIILNTIVIVLFSSHLAGQEEVIFRRPSTVAYLNHDPFWDTLLAPDATARLFSAIKPARAPSSSKGIGYHIVESKLTDMDSLHHLYVFPAINILGANAALGGVEGASFRTHLGAGFSYIKGDKWNVRGTILAGQYASDSLFDNRYEVLPNSYWSNDEGWEFQPSFRASFTPNRFFNFQAGIDQNFIGEGERSMLLSDNAAPYPFLKMSVGLWRMEYSSYWKMLRERTEHGPINKYAASHFLNISVTDKFQFGVFETVLFQPSGEFFQRGFEWEYFNPIAFYRPIEYALGSQDKVIIGTNFSYDFGKVMLFGQFVIDDFVLSEIVNRTRWWANKYGGQIGFKGKAQLGKGALQYRSELNFARPFLFAHMDEGTNYGHLGIPLAHPIGANFAEVFTSCSWTFPNSLSLRLDLMVIQQGGQAETPEVSLGSDIYISYVNRPRDEFGQWIDYGYVIGGDGQLNRQRISLEAAYTISKSFNVQAFIRPIVERQSGFQAQSGFLLFGGVRTNLWNERSLRF
ncbi:MAG: hypothetical protein JJT77_09300 [Crocinitomicaceae bacterium]|nr:hypothetical protein [Crocinitomicaceae bacterium]